MSRTLRRWAIPIAAFVISCTSTPPEPVVGEVSQRVEESGGTVSPPSAAACSVTCSTAGLAACSPFGVFTPAGLACGLTSIAACNAICSDDEKVCVDHKAGGVVDGKACINRQYLWWCDPRVDGRRVRAWYKLKDGTTHSPTNDPVATQWAPSQACHRVGWPNSIDVYKFRVCVEGTGCTNWLGAWTGAQLAAAEQDSAESVPFWRYFRIGDIDHFYTIWGNHAGLASMGYVSEGFEGRVFPRPVANTVPLYRYWNAAIGDHFYTTSWQELGGGAGGYAYEGIEAYIYDEPHAGSVPLHRYISSAGGDHYYTTEYYPNGMCYGICYAYEGVLGYVISDAATPTPEPPAPLPPAPPPLPPIPPPDTTPPTVEFKGFGDYGRGVITMAADARDDSGRPPVVRIYRDGVLVWTGDAAPYAMEWDTTGITGTFTITAEAVDGAGNTARVTKSFLVDNTPPTAGFVAPASGATLTGEVQLVATASDPGGLRYLRYALENGAMQYALGGLPAPKTTMASLSSPFTVSGNSTLVPNGNYDLVAEVADRAGNVTRISRPVVVANVMRVEITGLTSGQYVFGVMTASANVTATAGNSIARVELSHNNGAPIVVTTPPYAAAINFQGCSSGHQLFPNIVTVTGVDTAGNRASATVAVTLRTGRPCPNGGGGGPPMEAE